MMASFVELCNRLSQLHLDPTTKQPTLGLTTEIRLKRLKELKSRLRRAFFSELPGPLQSGPRAVEDGPFTTWDRLQVHCAEWRLQGDEEGAEGLEQALRRLVAVDTCDRSDVERVLTVLMLLAGSGKAPQAPLLGHHQVRLRKKRPPSEKKVETTPGTQCSHLTNKEKAEASEPYTLYSKDAFKGSHCSRLRDDVGSASWGLDPKILRARPGSSLHGLFNPDKLVRHHADPDYPAKKDLFGALVQSSVDSVHAKLSLPELPGMNMPEILGLRPPAMSAPSSDEGFESLASSCASSTISTPEKVTVPWRDAQSYQLCKHRTWDNLGKPGQKTERPYLTEAGPDVFDTLYEFRCQQAGVIAKQHPPSVRVFRDQKQLCRSALNVLLGLPSNIFLLDKETLTFTCNPHCRLSGTSTESFQAMIQFFADAGTDHSRLAYLTQREVIDSFYRRGLILQSFLGSVRKFLTMYQSAVMSLATQVGPDWTLLKMRVVYSKLVSRLRNLASLCGCDTRQGSNPGDDDDPLPTGIKLISHMYRRCLDAVTKEEYLVLLSLLRDTCGPYLMFIQDWTFHGVCKDLYNEFMIEVDNAHIFQRDKYYWSHGYKMRSGGGQETVPLFLGAMATDIFLCGKSINLLKLCCPGHFICNVDMATPRLLITFSSAELEESHRRTAEYSREMTILARRKTITRQQKEAAEKRAKEELAIRAHQDATKHMEEIKGNIRRRLEAADTKKRKIFQELKGQMQKELLRKTSNIEAERKEDKERMDALTLREESEASLETELEKKARAELIAHYDALTESARLRERRALWRVNRRNLDQARRIFLQEDEEKLLLEMNKLSNPEANGANQEAAQVGEAAENADVPTIDGNKITTSELPPPPSTQTVTGGDDEDGAKQRLLKEAPDSDVPVVTPDKHVNVGGHDMPDVAFSANQDIEPILDLIGCPGAASIIPEKDATLGVLIDLDDFVPKEDEVSPDEAGMKDTSVDDILLEIGSTLPHLPKDYAKGEQIENKNVGGLQGREEGGGTGAEDDSAQTKERDDAQKENGVGGGSIPKTMVKSDSADSGIGRSAISIPRHVSDFDIKSLIYPQQLLEQTDIAKSHPDITTKSTLDGTAAAQPQLARLTGHASDSSIQRTMYPTDASRAINDAGTNKPVDRAGGQSGSVPQQAPSQEDIEGAVGAVKGIDPTGRTSVSTSRDDVNQIDVVHNLQPIGHASDSTIQGMMYHGVQTESSMDGRDVRSREPIPTEGRKLWGVPAHLSHPSDSSAQGLMYPGKGSSVPKSGEAGVAYSLSEGGRENELTSEQRQLHPVVSGPSGHPSDSSIQKLMYSTAMGGIAVRIRARGLTGHPSDSSAQLIMYGKVQTMDEQEDQANLPEETGVDEGIDEEMFNRWREEMDRITFDFSAFKNSPTQDILTATGYMPSRSEVGDYCTQRIYDGNIDALDQLALPVLLERSITAPLNAQLEVGDSCSQRINEGNDNALDQLALSVLLEQAITAPTNAQIQIVNESILDYFHVELKIGDLFLNLRRYLFLEDGEFEQCLCDQLFEKLSSAAHLLELFSPISLNQILSKAVQYSGDESSDISKRLSFACSHLPKVFKPNSLDILDFLELKYTVDWPSNIVVTDPCLVIYNKIFLFLLKLKRTAWVLKDITYQLDRSAKVHNASSSYQYHQLQIFRHEMQHFVNVMQSYVANQVILVTWAEFQQNLKHNVHNLDDLRHQHSKYLDNARHRCLLNKRAAPVMKVITDIVSVVLKVRTQLVSKRWMQDDSGECVHPNFRNMKNLYAHFKDNGTFLIKVVSKLVTRGYQPHLEEFLMLLNFNDYYKDANGQYLL